VRISVVIPTLDEASRVESAVQSAVAAGCEVVVSDGGSRDETLSLARAAGASVVLSEPGRARQLQAGLRDATGDVVVFLHADTRLPDGWRRPLEAALQDPAVAGGAFGLRFQGAGAALRFLEWGVRWRVRLFGLPYGDQAIFVHLGVLEMIGGVPQAPFMEDLDLVQRMKTHGRVVILPAQVETSPRRYEGRALRHMLRNWGVLLGWRLGVDRNRLLGWYTG
jgi:rSAM/selenodomain-associated transferase 2